MGMKNLKEALNQLDAIETVMELLAKQLAVIRSKVEDEIHEQENQKQRSG
jgi:hypothetical protein